MPFCKIFVLLGESRQGRPPPAPAAFLLGRLPLSIAGHPRCTTKTISPLSVHGCTAQTITPLSVYSRTIQTTSPLSVHGCTAPNNRPIHPRRAAQAASSVRPRPHSGKTGGMAGWKKFRYILCYTGGREGKHHKHTNCTHRDGQNRNLLTVHGNGGFRALQMPLFCALL